MDNSSSPRGSFRGGPRGGFDRGRGRGLGRGGPMGGRGMGMPMRGRGGMLRPPRGMGGPPRGPRGGYDGRLSSRGSGRPPFIPPSGGPNNGCPATTPIPVDGNTTPTQTNTNNTPVPTNGGSQPGGGGGGGSGGGNGRGMPRGRGSSFPRGRGGGMRGSHKDFNMNGNSFRGGLNNRGRGNFTQNMGRQQFDTRQPSNTTTVTPVKRGAPSGPPGPKRGRFEGAQGPPTRQVIPKHPPPHHIQQQAPISSQYNTAIPANHHTAYAEPNQHQQIDQYSHNGYAQTSYINNGYNQGTYGAPVAATGYTAVPEYDQNHYPDYNNSYATHDQRYSGYTPDYTQSYATTTDYNTVPQEAYSQAQYDDRAYGGYDAQAYTQSYAKADQYQTHGGYY